MNAASKLVERMMKDPEGLDTTAGANPDNSEKLADTESGETMKALCWMSKNKVEVKEVKKPSLVDDHDIVIKVTGSTVCGSDMHLLHGAILEMQGGDILGHEGMGIVTEVGSAVKDLKVGDRVVSGFNLGCGECYMCRQKLSSACSKTNNSALMQTMYGGRSCGMLGYSHFTGGFAGVQAEYARIPHGDVNVIRVPDNVADEDALYVSDILVTSYHQVTDTGVKEGDIVAIWGCGPIGMMCAKWSLLKGAKHIILIDNVQWRLDLTVEKLRANGHANAQIDTINFDEFKNVPARVHELTAPGANGLDATRPAGADVCLEAAAGEYAKGFGHKIEMALGLETDTSEILNEMIESTISFGRIGVTGVYAGYTNHFNIGSLMERGIRLIGNGQAPCHKWMKEVMHEYVATGKVKPTELFVSHRISIDDIAKCYYLQDKHATEHKIMKPFVTTRWSSPPSAGAPQLTTL
ncbi:uncharacterized protein JCM15063_003186 [Sporobolomyces koalae]|uniref:uncharacterized protein n=1 Tax=Sporobolomyces koalae TaxID=500713 RepID=UPI00316E4C36